MAPRNTPFGEITPHEEVNVFLEDIGQPEPEEGLFGFEVADLQNTRDLLGQTHTTLHQPVLFRRKGEVLRALKVIEIRQAIYGRSLRLRYDGEIFVEGAHWLMGRIRQLAKRAVAATPTIVKPKVPQRRPNADYRSREYLSEKEVGEVIAAAATQGPTDVAIRP